MAKNTLSVNETEALLRTDVTSLIKRTMVLLTMQDNPLAAEWAAIAAPLAVLAYNAREREYEARKERLKAALRGR